MNFGTLKMFCVAFRDVNFLSSLNDSFVFAKIIWTLFFYIGITAGSHHFAPKCRPIITLEDIVVSSVENTTMEKSLLGHYTNIFSCELDCCQRRNCDLVLFDGKLCYGAFCSAENTCHFQSAKGEQTSYRAVFMNNILKENVTPNVTVNSLQITVPRSNGIDLSKNYKESNFSKHLSKLKLATKKKRFDGVSSNGKLRTNSTRYGQSCNINKIQQNVTLDSGTKAGIFKMHGKSRNIDQCAALCCKDKLCDLAVVMTGRCYTVQCFSEEDCDSRKTPSSDVIVAYKKRHWKNRADQKFKKKERGHEKISKKTVVPKSSRGNIGEILDSIRFLNGPSTVTSDMKFTFLRQCALYVEPENFTKTMHGWVTPRYTPVKYLYQAPDGISPPLGIRSAVPLGGMGTGSLELRADGSFHEWTLENQSPGGSVKLGPGALDKAVLGVRVSSLLGTKAAILRTHPPPGYPGVKSLSYSGLFPVSKLTVNDNRFFGVQMDLFAYGILHPRKTDSSFVPGLAFTLSVKNPTQKPLNVSFLLNMPLGEQPDTSRDGSNFNTVEDVESSAQCAVMCNEDKRCMAWSYERNTCYLKDSMPLHAYRTGVTSGVKGRWHINSRDSLTCKRPGNFPNSGSTTIMSINTNKPSFAVTDDFRSVWDAFDQTGRLRKRIEDAGFHGTIAVSAKLPAGTSETLTFILAWYYPNRDHAGQAVGQFYRKLFNSSIDVANHLRDTLITDLRDVISWQSNIVPPNSLSGLASQDHVVQSSLPDWLQDHLVNSLSFWRSGFRVADGRWRQWEALDCNDVDSVHNDFQRELPYLLFFPELLENVVRAWAEHQHPEGWIQETLGLQWGCHNRTNRLDTAGGRVMADVTPAFLAQLYHLYLWTGNANLLQDLWPAARKALIWLMRDSTGGTGLPLRKTCTYDIIYLEGYDYTTYNSVMYLLGLKVGKVLAEALGEQQLASTIQLAFDHGKAKIDRILWNEQDGFYHSWWDHKKGSPDWLMADSLYGQVWAYALGLGDLLDPEKMKRHLQKERELNDTPYGLRVLTQGKTKGLVESIIPRARHKRRINEADAVAHLDSFFSEVYGLQKKSNVAKKLIRMKNVTDKKSLGTPASSHRKLMASSFEEITRNRTKEDYVRRKDSNKTKTNSYKHMETINKWNQSTRTKMRPLTQEFLNHKNCFALEKESKFNSIWMGSDSDWSTLSIHLGMDPVKSLKQAEKALEHYRTTLNDLWNIHGLTAGQGYGVDGQPWCTSHYSFHLVLWHIPLALSGQRYDAVQQKLTFEPKLKIPYALPFFTPYASGIVKARQLNSGSVKYTVILTSGKLDINLLAVSRSMLPRNRVSLARGEYISWERK